MLRNSTRVNYRISLSSINPWSRGAPVPPQTSSPVTVPAALASCGCVRRLKAQWSKAYHRSASRTVTCTITSPFCRCHDWVFFFFRQKPRFAWPYVCQHIQVCRLFYNYLLGLSKTSDPSHKSKPRQRPTCSTIYEYSLPMSLREKRGTTLAAYCSVGRSRNSGSVCTSSTK